MNERRWTMDNQPYGSWLEKLPALCFPPEHPFHHSLIGSMEDLAAASLDDIAQFFATYYTPDNAVLSVAGDFESATVLRLIEQHFGGIPRGNGRPPLPDMSLPAVFGQWKREVSPDDIMLPRLFLAFRSPAFGTPEYYAASLCGAALGLRNGSRLRRRLMRERQVAAEATAFTFDLAKGCDLLVVDVTARPGVAAEQLEHEVAYEIDAVLRDGIDAAELERANALVQTSFISSMQQAGERADRLSLFATYFGEPRLVNEEVDRYQSVTVDDVNRFAQERLTENNRASLLYVPRDDAPTELVGAGAAAEEQ
jgi:predicted Zn-dependent peptidase